MLFPYKQHFFIADPSFLELFDVDPADRDLEEIGRDFARPRRREALARLVEKIVRGRKPEPLRRRPRVRG